MRYTSIRCYTGIYFDKIYGDSLRNAPLYFLRAKYFENRFRDPAYYLATLFATHDLLPNCGNLADS